MKRINVNDLMSRFDQKELWAMSQIYKTFGDMSMTNERAGVVTSFDDGLFEATILSIIDTYHQELAIIDKCLDPSIDLVVMDVNDFWLMISHIIYALQAELDTVLDVSHEVETIEERNEWFDKYLFGSRALKKLFDLF